MIAIRLTAIFVSLLLAHGWCAAAAELNTSQATLRITVTANEAVELRLRSASQLCDRAPTTHRFEPYVAKELRICVESGATDNHLIERELRGDWRPVGCLGSAEAECWIQISQPRDGTIIPYRIFSDSKQPRTVKLRVVAPKRNTSCKTQTWTLRMERGVGYRIERCYNSSHSRSVGNSLRWSSAGKRELKQPFCRSGLTGPCRISFPNNYFDDDDQDDGGDGEQDSQFCSTSRFPPRSRPFETISCDACGMGVWVYNSSGKAKRFRIRVTTHGPDGPVTRYEDRAVLGGDGVPLGCSKTRFLDRAGCWDVVHSCASDSSASATSPPSQ
jgi:hypothetical protein